MSHDEINALTAKGAVTDLDDKANLVCKAAEEITKNISVSDNTLAQLIDTFGLDDTSEIIMLVSWFNMLIRFVESMRVPYEENPAAIINGARPLALTADKA